MKRHNAFDPSATHHAVAQFIRIINHSINQAKCSWTHNIKIYLTIQHATWRSDYLKATLGTYLKLKMKDCKFVEIESNSPKMPMWWVENLISFSLSTISFSISSKDLITSLEISFLSTKPEQSAFSSILFSIEKVLLVGLISVFLISCKLKYLEISELFYLSLGGLALL